MTTLTLLDLNRWSLADTLTLGAVLSIFDARIAVVLSNGSMYVRIASELVDLFMAVIRRDVLPVEVVA